MKTNYKEDPQKTTFITSNHVHLLRCIKTHFPLFPLSLKFKTLPSPRKILTYLSTLPLTSSNVTDLPQTSGHDLSPPLRRCPSHSFHRFSNRRRKPDDIKKRPLPNPPIGPEGSPPVLRDASGFVRLLHSSIRAFYVP